MTLSDLQPAALLLHPAALSKHLQTLLDKDSSRRNIDAINAHILHLAHTEAVPQSIYRNWLSNACKYEPTLLYGALCDQNAGIRIAAIKIISNIFSKPSRKERGWDSLRGARGIKEIIDGLPLVEVSLFVKAICQGGYKAGGRDLLAPCFDELVALIEASDKWTSRSLSPYVVPLYARCTSDKVTEILNSKAPMHDKFYRDACITYPNLFRQVAVGVVKSDKSKQIKIVQKCAEVLVESKEAYDPAYSTDIQSDVFPPGLRFGVDVLSYANTIKPDFFEANTRNQWNKLVLDLAIRRDVPFDKIIPILNCGLDSLKLLPRHDPWSAALTQDAVQYWSMARFGTSKGNQRQFYLAMKNKRPSSPSWPKAVNEAALEKLLIDQVFKTKGNDTPNNTRWNVIDRLLRVLKFARHHGRLQLLQLACRHSPDLNFDLTAWPPSEEEIKISPIADHRVLELLDPRSSKALFQRLLKTHNCEDFIPDTLVQQNGWRNLDWESQCTLWAGWERMTAISRAEFPVTLKAIAEMKKRAMQGRESSERLQWTQSAIKLASASKSVEIFCDVVDWSKRYLRDSNVYPGISKSIHDSAGLILACGPETQIGKLASMPNIRANVQRANLTLKGILENYVQLLREPWAKQLNKRTTEIRMTFSTIIFQRFDAVKSYLRDEVATESELAETLLDSLLPVIIDFEREGNREDQAVFGWSGPTGVTNDITCPDSPSHVELSFMDRLQKARNDLWKDLRAQSNPDVCLLEPGLPRGLAIQHLNGKRTQWLYHALQRPTEAPFLSSRANEVLYSPRDIIIAAIPREIEPVGDFVDKLAIVIRAVVSFGEESNRADWLTRVWTHYSSALQDHPLQLELFQEWLVNLVGPSNHDLVRIIQPPILPPPDLLLSKVPTGSDLTEWDPQQDAEDIMGIDEPFVDGKRPKEIPDLLLNCLMRGAILRGDRTVRTRAIRPRAKVNPLKIWTNSLGPGEIKSDLFNNQETSTLSALLYLDTLASESRLLKTGFPDPEGSRYGPTYLADEFITRVADKEAINHADPRKEAVGALERRSREVPAQILRDLISSFLDTLKASPEATNYSGLLESTMDLINVLLKGTQPQLVVELVSRVWTEFPDDSSSHRKVSLSKIGRYLTPSQAEDLVNSLISHACEALENKKGIKITTLKMLVQGLTEADFLEPSTRLVHLEKICSASPQIDVRVEIVNSVSTLISQFNRTEPLKLLSSIALSAAGPSERDMTSEHGWQEAEAGGPLPPILDNQRPILEKLLNRTAIPEELRLEYVHKIVLPLVENSIRQHTRWMNILLARLGLSLSDLGLTASDIGPFSPDLVDDVLKMWSNYLPGAYLQMQRSWALIHVHRDSFDQIDKAFRSTLDPVKNDLDVQNHLLSLLESQRSRSPFHFVLWYPILVHGKEPNGITPELVLDEFVYRVNFFTRAPIAYNAVLKSYNILPNYMLLFLRALRATRKRYREHNDAITKLMTIIMDAADAIREEGWSPGLTSHPVTVPTKMEYEVELLPSPCKSQLNEFLSGIDEMISKYATYPALLINIDKLFTPILAEITQGEKELFALNLGEYCSDENDQHRHVKTWVRAKLASILLRTNKRSWDRPLSDESRNMLEKWKSSDIDMVRQLAWECDWDKEIGPIEAYLTYDPYGKLHRWK